MNNPTTSIDLDFGRYLASREQELSSHLVDGVPDYGFSLDRKLRQQIAAIGPLRALMQSIVAIEAPMQRQIQQMKGVAVSSKQYPELHAIAEQCARRLGIAIPQIFINHQKKFDSYTVSVDDLCSIIILTSELIEEFEPKELQFIIGMECGHIHNLHGIYHTFVELVLKNHHFHEEVTHAIPVIKQIQPFLKGAFMLFLNRWSRCAQITSDRAGLICCGDLQAAQMALVKLAVGGGDKLGKINLQEYLKQISQVQSTPVRLLEFTYNEPLIHKRIEALGLFSNCDVIASWREEMRLPNMRGKQEVDELSQQLMGVLSTKYLIGNKE
jgi:Zn-dependent protease with chaperone function